MIRPYPVSDRPVTCRPGVSRRWTIAAAGASLAILFTLAGCGSSGDGNSTAAPAGSAAAPAAATTPPGASKTADTELAQKAVAQINAIRATGRNCGGVAFAAAAPISWSSAAAAAADGQAVYMQTTGTLTHNGSGGATLGQRLSAAGYNWGSVGENIAFGYDTLEDVLQGWVESPGHCANLMSSNYAEIGIGQSTGTGETYWALVLARPRS